MAENVDDIRAALVKNPNFCRARCKAEVSPQRKNGFMRKKEEATHKLEDANGNICEPNRTANVKKINSKDGSDLLYPPLRRRSSDLEISNPLDRMHRFKRNSQILAKSKSPTDNRPKSSRSEDSLQESRKTFDSKLLRNSDSIELMDMDNDSDTVPKDTLEQVSNTSSLDLPLDKQAIRNRKFEKKDDISLRDILQQYSSIFDIDQNIFKEFKKADLANENKSFFSYIIMFCKICLITIFILVPLVLFYLLLVLYLTQPEPLYSTILAHLKLKEDHKLESLTVIANFIMTYYKKLCDYAYEHLESLVSNFSKKNIE